LLTHRLFLRLAFLAAAAAGLVAESARAELPKVVVDEARTAAAGIRKLAGKHLTLYTDLPSFKEVDELPEVFDLAVPQWCAYFHANPADLPDWRITAFLIKDKQPFASTGLLPDDLPKFAHGYSRGHQFWLYEQPTDYYRRHLLLHEGTHGFMQTVLGGMGPPWYAEGLAELMGTHRWKDGRLELGYLPASREEVPYWGRVKIVVDDLIAHRGKTLQAVLDYGPTAHRENGPYGWCWAAATFLERHPRYQKRFHELIPLVRQQDFNQRFHALFAADWDQLCEEWQVFVVNLEYGYDVPRMAIDFRPGHPLPPSGARATVAADRGWQSSGVRLEAGRSYRLRARGRYQVANQPRTWWCEPGGVTIRYYHGQPLGILLAAVHPDPPGPGSSPLIRPLVVGLDAMLTPQQAGTLYLRINHSAAELGDNAGSLTVEIQPQ
jgi:hypothetical protein